MAKMLFEREIQSSLNGQNSSFCQTLIEYLCIAKRLHMHYDIQKCFSEVHFTLSQTDQVDCGCDSVALSG